MTPVQDLVPVMGAIVAAEAGGYCSSQQVMGGIK